jgi:ubiquinone/menaquinone biosynthesis C-methylase UbiE
VIARHQCGSEPSRALAAVTNDQDWRDLERLDERAKRGWNETYLSPERESIWATVPFVTAAVELFRTGRPGPVLEVPCGGGRNTLSLARELPVLVACDTSPLALHIARRTLEESDTTNCVLIAGDVFHLPLSADQFSGVFCADLLAHLRRPVEAIIELLRVCRPGGRVIFNLFAVEDSTRTDPTMRPLSPDEYLYRESVYFRYYDAASVESLLRQVGVEPVSVEQIGWDEDAHPGYREYAHHHESWLIVVEKRGSSPTPCDA